MAEQAPEGLDAQSLYGAWFVASRTDATPEEAGGAWEHSPRLHAGWEAVSGKACAAVEVVTAERDAARSQAANVTIVMHQAQAERDRLARLVAAARRPITDEDMAAVLWDSYREALPGGMTADSWDKLGAEWQAPLIAAAREALKPTAADVAQAAELIRAQDAERKLRGDLAAVEAIINDDVLAYHERYARANQRLGRGVRDHPGADARAPGL